MSRARAVAVGVAQTAAVALPAQPQRLVGFVDAAAAVVVLEAELVAVAKRGLLSGLGGQAAIIQPE